MPITAADLEMEYQEEQAKKASSKGNDDILLKEGPSVVRCCKFVLVFGLTCIVCLLLIPSVTMPMERQLSAELRGKIIAFTVTGVVFYGVYYVLRSRGLKVVANACSFIAALTTTQLLMRQLSSPPLLYRYPGFVTSLHFFVVWIVSVSYWAYVGDISKCYPSSLGSMNRFAKTVVPIAISNPLTVVFNNIALGYAGAAICAVIATISPVACAILARAYGQRLSNLSVLGMTIACVGALMIIRQELQGGTRPDADIAAVTTGLCFALLSVLTRAFKIVLLDNLVAPGSYNAAESNDVIAPLHAYSLQAPFSFLVSFLFACATENLMDAIRNLTLPIVTSIGLTCVSATALNFIGVLSLKDLGANMQQLIGKLNTICTMAMSVGLLGEEMSPFVLLGSMVVLLGVGVFERGKHRSDSLVLDEQAMQRSSA